jgi:3',5'-cyclic AMP phosphodiesterase CpdA
MYKIAHISDLHINKEEHNANTHTFIDLLADIIKRNCNHLFITGDITNNANDEEYEKVKNLLSKCEFINSDSLTVTIGNHDIFGGAKKGPDVFLFPTDCKNMNYYEKVKKFHKQFNESFENTKLSSEDTIFPYLKILKENIAIIGINSVAEWSSDLNPIASNGNINDDNFKRIKKLLMQKKIKDMLKIVLIHHQFNRPSKSELDNEHVLWLYSERRTMRLHNKKRLFKLFKKASVDMILHGHTHITNSYKLKGSLFVNSSASAIPFTKDKKMRYHIISISKEPEKNKNFSLEVITL